MRVLTTIALLLAGVVSPAQQTKIEPRVKPSEIGLNEKPPGGNAQFSPEQSRSQAPSDYILGSGDQIIVRAVNVEEINDKLILIDMGGFVRLPVVGRIRAGGLTIAQLETELAPRL